MSSRIAVGLLLALASPALAAEPIEPAQACFDRFQHTAKLVMDHHIDPPTLQEMFLGGMQGLYLQAGVPAPTDLSKRISQLATNEQYQDYLKANWPKVSAFVTLTDLQAAFIRGLLHRLPDHVELIPAAEARALDQSAANRYVGTGIQLSQNADEKRPQINLAFSRGPFRKAGGKSGDVLMAIDGVDTKDMPLAESVKRLRGLEGTTVSMTVQQPGEKESRTLKVRRGPVPFETVLGYRRTGEESWQYRIDTSEPLAYVRLGNVLPSTPGELRKVEKTLLDDGIKGLVLDLRGNTGDDVQSAALTADELLDGGLMWKLHDNKGRTKDYRAERDCIFRDMPVVVLVGEFTRGASEFIAAALQDNHRAIVVGTPSTEPGTVTTLFLLPDDLGGMKLPTARLERAAPVKGLSRTSWQPVMPDHIVPVSREKLVQVLIWQNDQLSPDSPNRTSGKSPEDLPLGKALIVLRTSLKK